ncbi:MAG: DUF4956 domain-containing protein [Thermoguttaceae bacterium]|nr:DUF4956 domain-containing protein [Thermoguttaceae bacterium]
MELELPQALGRFQSAFSLDQGVTGLVMAAYLLLAGALGIYLRWLYRRSAAALSDSEAITRVFPLLVVITTGVIAVVKSSLAMSLGLVGALSIVRFRSAIKEPEELVYLFLCVAVGLALGAEAPLLALLLVAAASLLAFLFRWTARRGHRHSLVLTITGDAEGDFLDGATGVLAAVDELAGPYMLQRLDLDNGRGQLRLVLRPVDARRTAQMISQLRRRLPDCEFSCVNLNTLS